MRVIRWARRASSSGRARGAITALASTRTARPIRIAGSLPSLMASRTVESEIEWRPAYSAAVM